MSTQFLYFYAILHRNLFFFHSGLYHNFGTWNKINNNFSSALECYAFPLVKHFHKENEQVLRLSEGEI